jgi:ELWxxDGT repeat protein
VLADLVADLELALAGSGIDVAADAGRLVFSATDASVAEITIQGGATLGFDAGQQSVREGDRLFFVADRGELGRHLWVSDAAGTRALLESATADPESLAVVNGTLYFSAFDAATGARALWKLGEGDVAAPLGAQPFTDPLGLIDANGILVFSARPSGDATGDFEVFSYDGATSGSFPRCRAPSPARAS